MDNFLIKCDCGSCHEEEFINISVYTGGKQCSDCGDFCINCHEYVSKDEILGNRCLWCIEDY